jgi:hypothetical protein
MARQPELTPEEREQELRRVIAEMESGQLDQAVVRARRVREAAPGNPRTEEVYQQVLKARRRAEDSVMFSRGLRKNLGLNRGWKRMTLISAGLVMLLPAFFFMNRGITSGMKNGWRSVTYQKDNVRETKLGRQITHWRFTAREDVSYGFSLIALGAMCVFLPAFLDRGANDHIDAIVAETPLVEMVPHIVEEDPAAAETSAEQPTTTA